MKKGIILIALIISPILAWSQLPGIIPEAKIDEIICGDKLEIKDHMARMGFIIRSLRESVNDIIDGRTDDELEAIVMVDTQILRTHLTAVFPKTPEKIKNIKPGDLQGSKIIFQRYLMSLINETLTLEETLMVKPKNPFEDQARRIKIANTIIDMEEIVEEAHKKFRF